jgi:hypothetical protein
MTARCHRYTRPFSSESRRARRDKDLLSHSGALPSSEQAVEISESYPYFAQLIGKLVSFANEKGTNYIHRDIFLEVLANIKSGVSFR